MTLTFFVQFPSFSSLLCFEMHSTCTGCGTQMVGISTNHNRDAGPPVPPPPTGRKIPATHAISDVSFIFTLEMFNLFQYILAGTYILYFIFTFFMILHYVLFYDSSLFFIIHHDSSWFFMIVHDCSRFFAIVHYLHDFSQF
jgi:hypothetical protein